MTALPAGNGGGTRRFAVVGSPIGHSLSPVLHRAAYDALGFDDDRYDAHEVGEGELARFLDSSIGRGLSGLSVTMPGKREAYEIAARHDPISRRLGIANTLVRRADGSWRAENHDVHGILAALQGLGVARPARAAVLGSGATALSAVAALLELGVQDLRLTARRPERLAPLQALASAAVGLEDAPRVTATLVPWERAGEAFASDVVVSALAAPGDLALAQRLAGELTPEQTPAVLLDVLYHPWPVPLADLAERSGAVVGSGLEMLVHQAGRQVESFLGVDRAPLEPMRRAAREALAARS